jgi:hypothetical protein
MLREHRIARLAWTNAVISVYQQLRETPKEGPGGQGVASSNLVSPTTRWRIVTPDQSRIHPAVALSSTSRSAGELGPDWAHQLEYAAPASRTAW